MKHIYRIFIIALLLLPFSCTIYREYPIEVYTPEQVPVSPDVKSLVLLNRNFKYKGDSLSTSFKTDFSLRQDRKLNEKETDSLLINSCFEGFVTTINENKSFTKVNILPPDIIKRHYGDKLTPLNWNLIKKLTGSSGSDLLISLETYSAFFSEFTRATTSTPSNEVLTVAVWAVYDPVREKELERKSMIDTIYWNGTDDSGNPEKLPSREIALSVASKLAGQNYAKRFSSSWEKVYRIYGIPPVEDFRVAAACFEDGKRDEAINLWKKYTSDKIGRLAIIARYNMALASEMDDDMEGALNWIELAMKQAVTYNSREDIKSILHYKNILLKRANDMRILNQRQNKM